MDREIPRAPVLRVDRSERFVGRSPEGEPLLADHVLLHDGSAGRSARVADLQRGLEDLRGTDDLKQLRPVGLIDGEPVRQELIHVAHEAEQLLRLRLTLLADRPDLFALRIEDPVLVGHLDQLGFLADHEDVALKQARHAVILALPTSSLEKQALTEIERILRPGGRVSMADLTVEGELPPKIANNHSALAGRSRLRAR